MWKALCSQRSKNDSTSSKPNTGELSRVSENDHSEQKNSGQLEIFPVTNLTALNTLQSDCDSKLFTLPYDILQLNQNIDSEMTTWQKLHVTFSSICLLNK